MACPAIITGDAFLIRVIEHIDCQARILGSYGYASLGDPGSPVTATIAALLTVFVALYGLGLLFGPGPNARDTVMDVITIGIVLTLAFSWPAFRTLVHDVVLDGPAEIAAGLTSPELSGDGSGFATRLQGVDNALVALTELGTGRNTGQFIDDGPGSSFAGTAIADDTGFGLSRVVWLTGVIGTLVTLRVLAGLLLALAPLAAAMLFFAATRGLFAGWARGLVMSLVGTVGVSIMLAIELAMFEPYLADALRVRTLGYAIPSAPTELLGLALAFTIAKIGLVALLARVAWYRGWLSLPTFPVPELRAADNGGSAPGGHTKVIELPSRAQRIAHSVENRMRFEEGTTNITHARRIAGPDGSSSGAPHMIPASLPASDRLGRSYRRSLPRSSRSASIRDDLR